MPSFEDFVYHVESLWETNNTIIIQVEWFPDHNDWSKVVDYISTKNRCKVSINLFTEGFIPGSLLFSSYIMKELIEKHGFEKDDFTITFGIPDIPMNHELYNDCKEMYEYLPTPIFNNHWEKFIRNSKIEREANHNISIDKKILCLNSQPRLHRLAVVSEMIERNLLDDCILSFNTQSTDLKKYDCIENKLIFPNIKDRIDKNIDSIKHNLPIELTLKDGGISEHYYDDADILLHEHTMFSLVGESVFHNSNELTNKHYNLFTTVWCYPCIFVTEKTLRAIKLKHPFIIVSVSGFLKGLREMGYKTFHPYINESYDTIENEEERILAIMDEVERLCNMNPIETQKWLNSIQQITQYNYERLMNSAG